MGLHTHADHSFIIDVQKIRPLGEYEYAATLVRLHRHRRDDAPGEELEVPILGEQYGVTSGQAESRAIRVVKAYLDGKPDPELEGLPE